MLSDLGLGDAVVALPQGRPSTDVRDGVSLDDGPVQVVTASLVPTAGSASTPEQVAWVEAIKDHAHTVEALFPVVAAGSHVVKVWRLGRQCRVGETIVDMG